MMIQRIVQSLQVLQLGLVAVIVIPSTAFYAQSFQPYASAHKCQLRALIEGQRNIMLKANCNNTDEIAEPDSSRKSVLGAIAQSIDNNISNDKNTGEAASMVDYANLVGKLKTTPRVGWAKRQVPDFESVADHSWRVAALCFLLPPQEYNISRCIELAVVHDMAESLIGDITPEDNIPKAQKQTMELNAMQQIATLLSKATQGRSVGGGAKNERTQPILSSLSAQYLLGLFHEYEERISKEAVAVKDLDQLDMILQAEEYEMRTGIDLSDFFDGTPVENFRSMEIREAAREVHHRRMRRSKTQQSIPLRAVLKSGGTLSNSDCEFVDQFAKTSELNPKEIIEVVRALRTHEEGGT